MGELIGYMRVSKADGSQVVDLQRDALVSAGVRPEMIYEDLASGTKDDRLGLEACLKALRPGDVLCVWKLDRLGRNLSHLIQTVDSLSKRNVGFRALSGPTVLDTSTATGELMLAIFAGLASFERSLIRERTIAGLSAARARGRIGGRKPSMTPAKVRLAQAAIGKPETVVADLCQELRVSRQTLYRHVSPDGQLRPDGKKVIGMSR
jgi:DNA invertase Pin-like site-specific DNA recombinase